MDATTRQNTRPQTKDLVDALMSANRALMAVTARALGTGDGEVTMAQYRVLLLLCAQGTLRVGDLADELTVGQPSATRICARLAHKDLVRRTRSPMDRRSVRVSITTQGREVVEQVSTARRVELAHIIEQMPLRAQEQLTKGLPAFNLAAGGDPPGVWPRTTPPTESTDRAPAAAAVAVPQP